MVGEESVEVRVHASGVVSLGFEGAAEELRKDLSALDFEPPVKTSCNSPQALGSEAFRSRAKGPLEVVRDLGKPKVGNQRLGMNKFDSTYCMRQRGMEAFGP